MWVTVSYTTITLGLSGIPIGLTTIDVYNDNVNMWMVINGVATANIPHHSVIGNGKNWLLYRNSVAPYVEYDMEYKSGALVSWFQPDTIVNGTTLVDHQGNMNGIITWGANPTGIQVAIGSLTSSGQPSVGSTTTTTTVDILPENSPSDLPATDSEGLTSTLRNSPLRPLIQLPVNITAGFGSPLTEWQSWQLAALTAVLSVAVCSALAVRNHLLISGCATAAAIVGVVAYTIWPWYALLFAGAAILGGVIAERSPSL